jgi:site-specific DNA recombinase
MNGPVSRLFRCAIYTRKSTEHNLDLAFTSLDAQREACEAYVRSQQHEGWRLLPERYDDGGLSGASLARPALQALLAQVRERKIDVVVVYKVDRLTRSLADFAKLIELFDAQTVSFVAVTQQFNTTTSMGRLTLNILLSFAQFEREVIGERVRDKIAASKRKGIWVGGPVPLGYAAVDKKVLVLPAEAEAVRTIFARYVELGSVRALQEDLDRRGIRSKPRLLSDGRTIGGSRFGVGALAHLLRNRFYIGEVVYRGDIHRGEHESILDHALFAAVQGKLATQAVARRCRLRGSPALLTGRIFDECGNRMGPTHTNKGGARYRYYVSQAVPQNKEQAVGSIGRVPATGVEALVVAALRSHLSAGTGQQLPESDRDLVQRHLERVTLTPSEIKLRLRGIGEDAPEDLVTHARFSQIEGYRCLSLMRALGVVKCQLALVWLALRSCSQAAISSMRVCLSGMRRSRHWDDRMPSSDSARSSQALSPRKIFGETASQNKLPGRRAGGHSHGALLCIPVSLQVGDERRAKMT